MKAIDVLRWALAAAVLFAIGGVLVHNSNGGAVQKFIASPGAHAPLVYIFGYAVATVLFLPGSLLTLGAGAIFGPLAGALYSLMGASLGAVLAFLIARFIAGAWVARQLRGRLQEFVLGVDAEGWRFVGFARLVPLVPFNLLNYALGLTRIPVLQYAMTSFICMAPGALAYAYLGYAGREAAAGGSHMLQQGLIALALLASLMFLPRFVSRLRRPAVQRADPVSVWQRVSGSAPPLILDVRSAEEYEGELGHIAGALNIPVQELASRLPQVARSGDAGIVVVCKTDRRSTTAAEMLVNARLGSVEVMAGGMEAWRRLGYPVEAASWPRKDREES